MSRGRALTLYVLFAGAAVGLNVLVQRLVFAVYHGPQTIVVAMVVGAGVALTAKYFLDRKWVLGVRHAADEEEIIKYAMAGATITLVFFAFQYTIWIFYQTDLARDIGIVLGMAVGYLIKFLIDRKFVFVESRSRGKG